MSNLLVHNMDTAWTSSAPAVLLVSIDGQTFFGEGIASNRFEAQSGALNAFAEFVPGVALNLSNFEELRFWIRSDRPADGSVIRPFYLEFSYLDVNDAPGEEHRWFVPLNQSGVWEQRRIGIGADRRSAIARFRFRCLTDSPFRCHIDELLAVREEMLPDLEQVLVAQLDRQVILPGLTAVALKQAAVPGDTQIVLPHTPDFDVGNRILVQQGGAINETHDVTSVDHNPGMDTTTLHFAATDAVVNNLSANIATASVLVPVVVEAPPTPTTAPRPTIIATMLDAREDLDRTTYVTQRDSFRPRGVLTVCSVRPAARAYLVEYQLTASAPRRAQQILIQSLLLQRLSMDQALRINGVPSPVWIVPPPELTKRKLGRLAPVYVRIGTRLETAARQEQPWARRTEVTAGPLDMPLDQEGIIIEL
jgi:hypothetical protein